MAKIKKVIRNGKEYWAKRRGINRIAPSTDGGNTWVIVKNMKDNMFKRLLNKIKGLFKRKPKTCDFCDVSCGNSWCVTKDDK